MVILPQEYLLHYVHYDFFHNNQKLKTPPIYLDRRTNKETVENTRKECNGDVLGSMRVTLVRTYSDGRYGERTGYQ